LLEAKQGKAPACRADNYGLEAKKLKKLVIQLITAVQTTESNELVHRRRVLPRTC
jgi:hypothetical protein